jgi:hypothetical protein
MTAPLTAGDLDYHRAMPFMFPPPTPWKQRADIDPDREYVAFTSAFFLKSPWRVLAFIARSRGIMNQTKSAPGLVGWSLGANLFKLAFYTLSAWDDADSLRDFVHGGDHRAGTAQFVGDMRRKSIFHYYKVKGRDLPLSWKDALARQKQHDRTGTA